MPSHIRFSGIAISVLGLAAVCMPTLLSVRAEILPPARVPDGPGLGVQLDEEQLEKFRDPSGQARGIGSTTDTTFEG